MDSTVASHLNWKSGNYGGAGVEVVCREDNSDTWSSTLAELGYIPVSYSHAWIEYQLAYYRGSGGDWQDLSLVIFHGSRACALWPLSISEINGRRELSSHGSAILPPIFVTGVAAKSRKAIVKACLAFLNDLRSAEGITQWKCAEPFLGAPEAGLSEWHHQNMNQGATVTVNHELFVDLSLELSEIKAGFRKSYKSLITSGSRLWDVAVISSESQRAWEEFRELHLMAAGRVTRSDESWEAQRVAIADGDAILISLRDAAARMVGAGYFNLTRDEGVYSVGAYDRELFDKPLGHVVQFRAIQEMKARGLQWYKIGERPYRSSSAASEKEVAIAEFKHGFSTNLFPTYHLAHETTETISR